VNLREIRDKLGRKFGGAIGDWVEPEAGDAWIEVEPGTWRAVAESLKQDPELAFDFLRLISGTDYIERLEVVYHFLSYKHDHEAIIKIKLNRENPVVASVTDLWPAADWLERETYDMIGAQFEGHEELRRILLPDDWEGFPLRKDYKQPDEYHGISNW
jgi:NADH-quinone oxidoreductase subunit C